MFILNIRALGAGITFCGVGEVQTLLLKKKINYSRKGVSLSCFILKDLEPTITGLKLQNFLSLSLFRLYYVFPLMYLKIMNRWRMF